MLPDRDLLRTASGATPPGFAEVSERAPMPDRLCPECRRHLLTPDEKARRDWARDQGRSAASVVPSEEEAAKARGRSRKLRGVMRYCRYCQDSVLVAIAGSGDRQYLACRSCGAVLQGDQKKIAQFLER